jgi:hypothetical protein
MTSWRYVQTYAEENYWWWPRKVKILSQGMQSLKEKG